MWNNMPKRRVFDITNKVTYIGNIYELDSHAGFGGDVFDKDGLARALMARDYKDPILVLDV